jgi:FkbM family methyltransferase
MSSASSPKTYSQIGQDRYVIDTIFGGAKTDGFYVDVGAHDGTSFSNTCLLDRAYNWRGICVEPLPDTFAKLRAARPRATCVRCAAYDTDDQLVDFVKCGAGDFNTMFSGIREHITHGGTLANPSLPMGSVRTRTLTAILDEAQAPRHIDYLSIDTEGSELHVLRGIDFARYSFGFISVEHNFVEPRRAEMRAFLCARGYTFHRANQWDDDYKLSDL